ncbi:MAG: hypothetical protein C0506_05230 [Anaerolinea sp.]|nr:hypothetical protein [Anaerolinea sp.]
MFIVTVQAIPWPPTLLAVSLLHCVTGAAAAFAEFGDWLASPMASIAAASTSMLLVPNNVRRKAIGLASATVVFNW